MAGESPANKPTVTVLGSGRRRERNLPIGWPVNDDAVGFSLVRAHLLELSGDTKAAIVEFRVAAGRTANLRERHYLTTRAARLAAG